MNYNELWHQLAPLYGDGEAKAIAQMVYEVRYGLTLPDIYLGKGVYRAYHHTTYTFFNNKVGTRRRLTIVRTRL